MKTFHKLAISALLLGAYASCTPCLASPNAHLSSADKKFIKNAAYGGNDEIALSKIAVKRSKNPQIQAFAHKMIIQHSEADQQLKAIAANLGQSVPTTVDPAHFATEIQLDVLSGTAFNHAYINAMVKDHTAADHLFRTGEHVDNPRLRNFAMTILPIVDNHLRLARELQQGKNVMKMTTM